MDPDDLDKGVVFVYSGPDLGIVVLFADPNANRKGNISYRFFVSKTRSATIT